MTAVKLNEIVKRFGTVTAADHVTLAIESGQFFTLLGPSGCGKTTILRIIAGLEIPDSGQVFFDSREVTWTPPYERGTGMVFQNYALWPHMKVFENVAYGLRVRKAKSDDLKKRVNSVLDLVQLEGLEDRFPTQLSGGQQQRVALARALVIEPKVLLLDEPLSNLDARLRIEMREELKNIQKKLGITAIYVTHDQEEALVLSDRLAIVNKGAVYQTGTPHEIYSAPNSLFVATFIGRCTLFPGTVQSVAGKYLTVAADNGMTIIGVRSESSREMSTGERAICVIRPENFQVETPREAHNTLDGKVKFSGYYGSRVEVAGDFSGVEFVANLESSSKPKVGESFRLYAETEDVTIIPEEKAEERSTAEKS